jgi:hypothetical protein
VLGGPGGEIPPGYSTMWGNDCLTEPELFGERSNNSLAVQGGAPRRLLQSAAEAISHNCRFVLKSDTKLTYHFVCDLSTRVSALTTITGVLKGDKLLKTIHQNFQFLVQRDTSLRAVA